MPTPVPAPPPVGAPLTDATLALAVDHLASLDPVLAASVERHGRPPLWAREPGFPTLVHIVLEQQVSLASARAAFDRLRAVADPLTPAAFLTLDDRRLLEIGFSRQKTRYGRELARAVAEGRLDLAALVILDDDAVDASLTAVPGIGPWPRPSTASWSSAAPTRGRSTTSPSPRRWPTCGGWPAAPTPPRWLAWRTTGDPGAPSRRGSCGTTT
jgi:HhH-GPD superfamily base excision DNA repair protein